MSPVEQLPRISVITPCLNQGRFLRQCIDSILDQNYPELEIMIFDGGSTDESLSIIEEYAGSISYWVSEPDNGQSDAINKGFRRASGEIVTWLNADDFYLPSALERVAEAYYADQSAPFFFGDGLRVDESGSVLSKYCPNDKLVFNRQALLLGLNYILQPATFINRRALERIGYLDAELVYGMDSDLWIRLSKIGLPRPIEAKLAASREYASTKSASGSFARAEELRQIAERHSGASITPGVLCYYLDTLYRFAKQNGSIFHPSYLSEVTRFWKRTAELFELFDTEPNGFPRGPGMNHDPFKT